jgi:hypothetical protein
MQTEELQDLGGQFSQSTVPVCRTCGALSGHHSYANVYALGKVEPRFPSLSIEKEFAQVAGRTHTSGLTDGQTMHAVLSNPENRYIARQLCWILTIQGMDTYVVVPRDPADIEALTASVRPTPRATDVDVVVGVREGMAPPEICNGLTLPLVRFDQLYSFDVDSLTKSIPSGSGSSAKKSENAAEEVFLKVMNMTQNSGVVDRHRALNYLAVRYPGIYLRTAEQFASNFSLTSVNVSQSSLSSGRNVVDVVFTYTNRQSDFVDKYFVRVDVTEEFPFLVSKISPYYDR